MSQTSVLVVDDEIAFREALQLALIAEGFVVYTADDGESALRDFDELQPDLVLLDMMLPRMSGIDVCRRIRTMGDTPVIMVSARSEEIDAVVALEIGADDYITKPYRLRELIARMRTVLRRSGMTQGMTVEEDGGDGDASDDLVVGSIRLDRQRHEVRLDGALVELPLKEFQVLAELMRNAGFVVSRDDLINRVWGYDYVGDTKTLDVHIKRLRAKVEADSAKPKLIVTIRGLGYKMVR